MCRYGSLTKIHPSVSDYYPPHVLQLKNNKAQPNFYTSSSSSSSTLPRFNATYTGGQSETRDLKFNPPLLEEGHHSQSLERRHHGGHKRVCFQTQPIVSSSPSTSERSSSTCQVQSIQDRCHPWSIHSARPTVSPVLNFVFAWNLICFVIFWKTGTDARTTCAKTIITTGRDCGLATWINYLNVVLLETSSINWTTSKKYDVINKYLNKTKNHFKNPAAIYSLFITYNKKPKTGIKTGINIFLIRM